MRNIIKIASVFALIFAMTVSLSYGQDNCREWTMDQYEAKMAELAKREADAKAELAATEKKIEEIGTQTAEVTKQDAAEWQAIYEMLGITEADIDNFSTSLNALEGKIDELAALSPEELFKRRKEIESGKSWMPFDQISFVIGSFFIVNIFSDFKIPILAWFSILILSFFLHIIGNRIGFWLKISDSKM